MKTLPRRRNLKPGRVSGQPLEIVTTGKLKGDVMHLNLIRKGLFVVSAICLVLLWSRLSYGQELVSFQSSNYPTYYIRHRFSLFRIDKIRANDKLGRNDATFRQVPGLAGRCASF